MEGLIFVLFGYVTQQGCVYKAATILGNFGKSPINNFGFV